MKTYNIELTAEQLQSIQWLLHENDRHLKQRMENDESNSAIDSERREYKELYENISDQVGAFNWAELE